MSDKGKIWISPEIPKDRKSYFEWLSQIMNIYHHADLHQSAMSISTNPLRKSGAGLLQYKSKMEAAIQEKEAAYRSFINHVSEVEPGFKDKFPAKVQNPGWPRYIARSLR